MLTVLMEPKKEDVRWLIEQSFFSNERRRALLLTLVGTAPAQELANIFSGLTLLPELLRIIGHMDEAAAEALAKILENLPLVTSDVLDLLLKVLPNIKGQRAEHLAARGLYAGLGLEIGTSRDTVMQSLLEKAGKDLDAAKAVRAALSTKVPSEIASQNLILFERTRPAVRAQFVKVPQALAESIIARRVLDLSYEAANAAGRLLWDASTENRPGFAQTAAMLLAFAMREHRQPASALIAATFPSVYRELQQESIPDFLAVMYTFLDWDRCKIARRELAAEFSRSEWLATDIALAAARAGDTTRILKRIARSKNGQSVLMAIECDIEQIQLPWRRTIQQTLTELRKEASE
jgi:hypothetical protein